MRHGRAIPLAVWAVDDAQIAVAEPSRVLRDSVKDRPQVGWRGCDDAQDVGGRGLLLHGRSQGRAEMLHVVGKASVLSTQRTNLTPRLPKLLLELRDPRVAIVRHHVHPGCPAPLRDGARIARGPDGGL